MIHDPPCRELLTWVCSEESYGLTSLIWHVQNSPGSVMLQESELDHGSSLLSESPGWALDRLPSSPSTVFSWLHSPLHVSVRTKCCPTWQSTAKPVLPAAGSPNHIQRVFLYGLATRGGGDPHTPLWFSVELLAWWTYMANDDRRERTNWAFSASMQHTHKHHWDSSEHRKLFRQPLKYSDKISNSKTAFDRKAENNP